MKGLDYKLIVNGLTKEIKNAPIIPREKETIWYSDGKERKTLMVKKIVHEYRNESLQNIIIQTDILNSVRI